MVLAKRRYQGSQTRVGLRHCSLDRCGRSIHPLINVLYLSCVTVVLSTIDLLVKINTPRFCCCQITKVEEKSLRINMN